MSVFSMCLFSKPRGLMGNSVISTVVSEVLVITPVTSYLGRRALQRAWNAVVLPVVS